LAANFSFQGNKIIATSSRGYNVAVFAWFYNATGLHLTKHITAQNKKTEYAEWSMGMSCIHSQVHNFEQAEGKTKPGNEETKAVEFIYF
jgi:hypothetical protein